MAAILKDDTASNPAFDEHYDLVVVGSGAACVCAGLVAHEAKKRVLVLEKNALIGGSTALSGGVFWVPNNPIMKRAGVRDSYEHAKAYLDACAGTPGPGSTPERRHAFLTEGPELVSFLERHGMKWVHAEGWSDYHEGELPGGVARSRSLVTDIYSMRRLGDWRHRVARAARPPLRLFEASALSLYGKTWKSKRTMAQLAWRLMLNRLGCDLVGTGMAVQGRLFEIAKRVGIPIWAESPVLRLMTQNGKITGVVAKKDGRELRIGAHAVLIDAGGFAHNRPMREKYQPRPTSTEWTNANAGDTGEVMQMAIDLGAATAVMDLAWWNSVSMQPGGSHPANVMDLSKPHCIIVDASGQRFVNESTSYVTVGMAMYERHKTAPAVPSWAILESRHRENYLWGGMKPGTIPDQWLSSGYMMRAGSLDELAAQCSIDAAGLKQTIERFNRYAREGHDPEFHRGGSAYNRFFGDPTVKPNPNLGAIERAPFYAVKIFPGDVGTAGGLVCDEFARVLRDDGTIIDGLYATGNATAPVIGRSYPGAGASISSSAVFGFIAAKHALGVNTRH